MHGLCLERRSLNGNTLLSWDLARHLYARGVQGKVTIVTSKPTELMPITKKQWNKLTRQVQRERASTLNAVRINELTRQIAWMQNMTFSAKAPSEMLEADVTFANVDDFLLYPPECSTIYVTYPFAREKLHILTSWMPKNSVVVEYA